VRSASASTAGKTGKGSTPRKAAKKAPAKAARKGTPKPAGAAKKAPAKKAAKKATAKARKPSGRKQPEKRAGAHKAPKAQRKPAAPKKTPRAPAKTARKAPAKKPAKRAAAKKAVKAPVRKTAKERPARKAAPKKTGLPEPQERGRPLSESSLETLAAAGSEAPTAPTRAPRRRAAEAAVPEHEDVPEVLPEPLEEALQPAVRRPRGDGTPRKRRKVARFDVEQPEVRKKKRARLEKMRRAGVFGVPGARPRRARKRKPRDEMVRPSPPLEKTDPLKHYLAGEMVPCPVGCGGFSEVVRVSTMDNGAGDIWFECLSCAQRKMFEIPPARPDERKAVFAELEAGHEPLCPRHTKSVSLRRRGRDFVCPECGVRFAEP
jgi:hypothetical protein